MEEERKTVLFESLIKKKCDNSWKQKEACREGGRKSSRTWTGLSRNLHGAGPEFNREDREFCFLETTRNMNIHSFGKH